MALRSSSVYAPGSNGTSWVVPVPSGAAVGDIITVGGYKENTAAVTPPDGTWTSKAALTTSGTAHGALHVFWKRLTAADTGTYTFTWTGSAFRAAAASCNSGRVATGDPFDVFGTNEPASTSTTANVSVSPATASGDAVGFWTNFNGGGTFTAPTNYTQRQSASGVIALETRDAIASGSTGNVSATNTITDWMKGFLGVLAPAGSGVTGTATPTEANDTSSASGQLGYSGTSAAAEANDTSSATGTVINPVTGTSAVTQANQTSNASGQLGYSGTSARTQANQTSSASGQLGYSGTSAVTQAAQTASASGTFTAGGSFAGTIAVTQANQTSSASGQLGYSGTSARTQANQTSAASGTVVNPVTGTASVTQANQFSTATGILQYTGTLSRIQANQTATASGLVVIPITGTIARTQANQFATASGVNQPLVSFGTSSAGVGIVPSSHPNAGLAPFSTPAAASTASASAGSDGVPTSTGA